LTYERTTIFEGGLNVGFLAHGCTPFSKMRLAAIATANSTLKSVEEIVRICPCAFALPRKHRDPKAAICQLLRADNCH